MPCSHAEVFQFIAPTPLSHIANQDLFIASARKASPFRDAAWEDSCWDVSSVYKARTRAAFGKADRFHFTQHLGSQDGKVGKPFEGRFADIAKAVIVFRYLQRRQVSANQMTMVRAMRYLWQALGDGAASFARINPDHFDAAALAARDSEPKTFPKLAGFLEELANTLDANQLLPVRLQWACCIHRRPMTACDARLNDPGFEAINAERLPKAEVVQAIGHLYQAIPRTEEHRADRILICISTLLVCLGLRISEALSLPAEPMRWERNSDRVGLAYFPAKGADPAVKWLISSTADLVQAVVEEVQGLTAEARRVAAWIVEHRGRPYVPEALPKRIPLTGLAQCLGITTSSATFAYSFCSSRAIAVTRDDKGTWIASEDLVAGLARDVIDDAVAITKKAEILSLDESLAVCFLNELHGGNRPVLRHAVRPITRQHVSDFLGSGRGDLKSVFDRYAITDADGAALRVNTHAFRHALNDMLDRGGLPDTLQARWFRRKNPVDNATYQHATPFQRAAQVKKKILDGAPVHGHVADLARRMPVERATAYLEVRIKAVHRTEVGMCAHDFAQTPCPRRMRCLSGCTDLLIDPNNETAGAALLEERSFLEAAIEAARSESETGTWGAEAWAQHYARELENLNRKIIPLVSSSKGGL